MTTDLIKKIVEKKTGINLNDPVQTKSRRRENVTARKLYCKFCRQYTNKSLASIGETLNPKKDHATVLHNARTIEDLIEFDPITREKAESIQSLLEYIRAKHLYGEKDLNTQIASLARAEQIIDGLQHQNQRLLDQLEDLQNKIKKQNKYLEDNGYNVNMSVFKDL